jgi:hypothetical protein
VAITAISRDWGRDPAIVRIVTTDNLATITTAGYLTAQEANIEALNFGEFDWADTDDVLISYSGGEGFFTRDATNETFVAQAASPGSLSNTLLNGRIFVGNASNIATGVAMTGDVTTTNAGVTSIGANKVLSSMVSPLLEKYIAVPVTAAEWNGMFAAPKLLLAAQGANTLIVVKRAILSMTFVSAAYAAGGVVTLQYDATVNGAGVAASNTEAAADFFAAASTAFQFEGVSGNTVAISPFTTSVNKGLYISNKSGAFTTGDGTWVMHVWYAVIPTV